MPLRQNVKMLYSLVHKKLRQGRHGSKQGMTISAPFNFREESVVLPGISSHEISVMREEALAGQMHMLRTDDEDGSSAASLAWSTDPPVVNIIPPSASTSVSSESALSIL